MDGQTCLLYLLMKNWLNVSVVGWKLIMKIEIVGWKSQVSGINCQDTLGATIFCIVTSAKIISYTNEIKIQIKSYKIAKSFNIILILQNLFFREVNFSDYFFIIIIKGHFYFIEI